MPRIEFESEDQQKQFNEWIGRRNLHYDVTWVGEFDLPEEEGEAPKVLKALIIGASHYLLSLKNERRIFLEYDV